MTDMTKVKDIIEAFGLINDLADRIEGLEKKFEEHLEDDSEEIRNELARQIELIAELKESVDMLKRFQQGYIDRIINLEEVLRDLGNKIIGWEKEIHTEYNLKCFIKSLTHTIRKLDSPTSHDPYYACGKLKTEKIPIGDDLMKRITSHKSVPMDKSKYKTDNVMGHPVLYTNEETKELLKDVGSASARESLDRQTEKKEWWKGDTVSTTTTAYMMGQRDAEKDKPKAEPEKSDMLDALLHVVAPIPLSEVHKLLKQTEERVRDATRKELIEEFIEKIEYAHNILNDVKEEKLLLKFLINLKEEYEGRLEK